MNYAWVDCGDFVLVLANARCREMDMPNGGCGGGVVWCIFCGVCARAVYLWRHHQVCGLPVRCALVELDANANTLHERAHP